MISLCKKLSISKCFIKEYYYSQVLKKNYYYYYYYLFIYMSFLRMATKDHVAGYAKYFGSRFANLSPEATTEEQIKDVYKEWASKFDEVIPE